MRRTTGHRWAGVTDSAASINGALSSRASLDPGRSWLALFLPLSPEYYVVMIGDELEDESCFKDVWQDLVDDSDTLLTCSSVTVGERKL